MKICVAQTKPVPGDVAANAIQHRQLIALAVNNEAEIIVFPELSLTGYEPGWASQLAILPEDNRLDEFQTLSNTHEIVIGVGAPTKNSNGICISLILFRPLHPRQVYSKKYLHSDEEPFFVSGENSTPFRINTRNIAFAICYELSVPEHAEFAYQQGAEIYIASVAKTASGIMKAGERLSEIAKHYSMMVLMSNSVGPCDNFVSAGGSAAWNSHGSLLMQLTATDEGLLLVDTLTEETRFIPKNR